MSRLWSADKAAERLSEVADLARTAWVERHSFNGVWDERPLLLGYSKRGLEILGELDELGDQSNLP